MLNPRRFSSYQNALGGLYRLARALPEYYRSRPTVREAEEEIRAAVARRGETFLAVARERIYGDATSPYLRLLRLAGCDFADLAAAVRANGLEPTLERLAAEGVYLTVDEYRGKTDVRRRGAAFRVTPEVFQRRDGAPGIIIQTGGSTGRPLAATASLARLDFSVRPLMVFFSAHGLFDASHALVDSILPGSGGTCCMLIYTKIGVVPKRWFARVAPTKNVSSAIYHRFSTRVIAELGNIYGPGFPRPKFVEGIQAAVEWIASERARGLRCCITASSSNAVRIAGLARRLGTRIDGTVFITTGEPLTEAKRDLIEAAGATATCRYAFTELGMAGYGCGDRRFTDEVHVLQNFATVIRRQAGELFFTTIDPSADRLLLNVANGDSAILEQRDCGCALQQCGLGIHLHGIRGIEKFTAEGMNYLYGELADVIDKVLPAEFGGTAGDYQLAEEEEAGGATRVVLRIHPNVGAVDEQAALRRLRRELARGSWEKEFQVRMWERTGTLKIEREAPLPSANGNMLPLRLQRNKAV